MIENCTLKSSKMRKKGSETRPRKNDEKTVTFYKVLGRIRRSWSQDVWRPVAGCGGLWRAAGRESWALKTSCPNPK